MSSDYSDLEDELPTTVEVVESPQRKRIKLDSNPNTPDSNDKEQQNNNHSNDDELKNSQAEDDSIVMTAQKIPIVIDLTALQAEDRTKYDKQNTKPENARTDSHNTTTSSLPDPTLHLLPCFIDYNGSANIETYFLPTIQPIENGYSASTSSNIKQHSISQHYKSSFRGRGLIGECLQLDGYAVVVQEDIKQSDRQIANTATDVGSDNVHRMTNSNDGKLHWTGVECTDRLWLWCRDEERHERDTLKRALVEWPALANALHAPIPI